MSLSPPPEPSASSSPSIVVFRASSSSHSIKSLDSPLFYLIDIQELLFALSQLQCSFSTD
jgi:hypothetical protein